MSGTRGTFELLGQHGEHEQVVFCHNKDVGLKAIIAIHNTTLGPALGGTRMWNYRNEEEALIDVLRLSKGMTYKASAAGLNLGGGKAVIIGDPKTMKTEGLFRAFGRFVNSLNGRYITAEDVGTTVREMEYVFMETSWVTGIPKAFGGSGDPSPYTAHGVLMGIKASAKEKFGAVVAVPAPAFALASPAVSGVDSQAVTKNIAAKRTSQDLRIGGSPKVRVMG
jgi:leucine dehydrogenase